MVFRRAPQLGRQLKKFASSQTVRNSYFGVLDVLVMPVLMLVATPLFLTNLGAAQYGVWMLVNSIVASLGMADIGAADATIKSVSSSRGASKPEHARTVFSAAVTLYLLLAILLALLGFSLIPLVTKFAIFKVDADLQPVFANSLRFGVLVFSTKLLEQVLLAYFKGYERYDVSSKLSMTSKSLTIGTQILVVLLGGSLTDVFAYTLASQCFMIAVEIFALRSFDSELRLRLSLNRPAMREIFDFGIWAWLCSMMGILSMQIDKWLIGSLAGMTTLAYYSIAALVSNNLRAIMAAGASWSFPRVSKAGIRSDGTKQLYSSLQLILVTIGLGICILLLLFDELFLYWLGNEAFTNSIDYIRAYLLVIPIAAATIAPYFFIIGGGYIRYNVIYRLAMSVSNIVLMLALYPLFGVYGIILSYALTYALISSAQRSILERKVFGERNLLSGLLVLLPALFLCSTYFAYAKQAHIGTTAVLTVLGLTSYAWMVRRHIAKATS